MWATRSTPSASCATSSTGPGALGFGEPTFAAGDLVVCYEAAYAEAARAAAANGVAHALHIAVIEPELFYPREPSAIATRDCWYLGKAEVFPPVWPPDDRAPQNARVLDAWYPERPVAPPGTQITRGPNAYPRTRAELGELLRETRTLYSFDRNSMLLEESRICGASVRVWHGGEWSPWDCECRGYAQRWHEGEANAQRLVALIEQHFPKKDNVRLVP